MFNNHFTTNCSQNAAVKKFLKSVNIWQIYVQNFVAYFFGPPCILINNNILNILNSNRERYNILLISNNCNTYVIKIYQYY